LAFALLEGALAAAAVASPSARPALLLLAALAGVGLFLGTIASVRRARARGPEPRGELPEAQGARVEAAFLGDVSRELAAPLDVVVGMADVLDHTSLSGAQKEYVAAIRRSSSEMRRMIEDVRDASGPREEEAPSRSTRYSLAAVAAETTSALASVAEGKGLTLLCDVSAELPDAVLGDPDLLRRLLESLLRRAIRTGGHGEIVLRIHPEADAEGRPLVAFTLSVPSADASAAATLDARDVGLAVAERLARRMGGRLRVDDVEGVPPHLRLVLPLFPDRAPSPDEEPGVFFRGLRVLVLESAAGDRQAFGRLLGSLGVDSTLVADAETAVAELRRAADEGRPYAVAIVDASTRGAAALRARRREDDPVLARIPKIHTWKQARLAALAAEDGPRILKPATRADIVAALERALGSGPSGRRSSAAPAVERTRPRVLVVDASPVSALVTSRIVEAAGGEARVVSGRGQAGHALAEHSFALAVVDASHPEHPEVQALLRESHAGLPVLRTPVSETELRAAMAGTERPVLSSDAGGSYDRRRLVRNLGDDEAAADQVLAAFLAQADELLDALRSARASGDLASVARTAHRLKGSLLWIGAQKGAAAVSHLESRAMDGDRHGTRTALEAAETEVLAVVADIRGSTIP
jgi:HPt (histidine-containing phosphotransfer) domain-containing protein